MTKLTKPLQDKINNGDIIHKPIGTTKNLKSNGGGGSSNMIIPIKLDSK